MTTLFQAIRVVYDRGESHDRAGAGARAVAQALRDGGLPAEAVELPDWLGVGGDVDDLHRTVGDGKLAATLAGLPILDGRCPGRRDHRASNKGSAFAFAPLTELWAEQDDAAGRWLLDSMLPIGGVSTLVGKPKIGKSTTARTIALNGARGTATFGRDMAQGPVLYIALEEIRSEVRDHFKRMGARDEPVYVSTQTALPNPLAALSVAISAYQPLLVIIDPLYRFLRVRDANDYAEVSNVLAPVVALARTTGCHIMFVHHMSKRDRGGGDGILGSTALFGAVDTALLMQQRGEHRTVQSIQRYGHNLPESIISLDPDTGIVALSSATLPTDQGVRGAVIAHLSDEPRTESDVRTRVGGDQTAVALALRALVEEGLVLRTGAGRKGDPYLYALASG